MKRCFFLPVLPSTREYSRLDAVPNSYIDLKQDGLVVLRVRYWFTCKRWEVLVKGMLFSYSTSMKSILGDFRMCVRFEQAAVANGIEIFAESE